MDSPIDSYLRDLHAEISGLTDGTPYSLSADLPALDRVDPDAFGICIATVDGYVYEVGATRQEFSVQSISKPFTYGLALMDLGPDAVDAKIDVEPSGESFNEISLAAGTGRPANAMINAGALAATGLIRSSATRSAMERIVDTYSSFAGRQLVVDEEVFEQERAHSDRNHALAYLLRSYGIIEVDPTTVLECYLRGCAVQVTCRDLSIMAATLANGGTNPLTERTALTREPVERVLSVMMTSGMYDDAGEWVSAVGMPAKSGVGGGTLAVLPGQAGLAAFSPRLNEHGTSVRGGAASERISRDMEMHFVRAARAGRSAISNSYDVRDAPSGIQRAEEAALILAEHGHRVRIIELNGDLLFAGTESVVREITALAPGTEIIIVDGRRVNEIGSVAVRMLTALEERLMVEGTELMVVGMLADVFSSRVESFATRASAIIHAENHLIGRYGDERSAPASVPVSESSALVGMGRADVSALVEHMDRRHCRHREVIRRAGAPFEGIFFIVSGTVRVIASSHAGTPVELTTLAAGMTFGELAMDGQAHGDADVEADGSVELMVLTDEAISAIEVENPRLAVELWKALARASYRRVHQYLSESTARRQDRDAGDKP